ncbi:probable apyrase 6 [Punica granatum]|uniref:apyrase n=2 Tax=Punica granatum TaxID=22663 RepID=A0A2I0HYQ6_PUNGR|nr:probable apyrase 6 [Punica granatum]PKI36827.1 hypothetical protein CRG98_042776 [Punica granatum]
MRRLNARKPAKSPPKMDPIKLHLRPTARSSNLFSRSPGKQQPRPNLCILSSILISLSFLLCYLFLFPKNSGPPGGKRYAIVIDGGSTGTRIHVFGYSRDAGKAPAFDFGEGGLASMRVNPGLSAYAEDPESAGRSLRELIEFGKQRVPREQWANTEIRLMATAGMRLLELPVQYRILESCRGALRESGFKFRDEWASVIKGSDEGVYAWVVANYALGSLGGDPLQTTGIVELGGASAQVTFSSSEPLPPKFSRVVKFGNITYNLYSHSFLHFGQNVAFETLRELIASGDYNAATDSLQKGIYIDPCIPKGYSSTGPWRFSPGPLDNKNRHIFSVQSQGNFSECRSAALHLLQKGKDKCTHQHCYIGSVFTPKLQGKFLATENFFHTSKFFGLAQKALLSDLMSAGQRFCGEDWSVLKKRHSSLREEDLLHYCFSSAYIVALLHDSLGITLNDERIWFTNQVGSVTLDWALGAFILQSTESADSEVPHWFSMIIGDDSHRLLLIGGILVIITLIGWFISKWRKPQLKTIYDLEKGRYIITRVNRY